MSLLASSLRSRSICAVYTLRFPSAQAADCPTAQRHGSASKRGPRPPQRLVRQHSREKSPGLQDARRRAAVKANEDIDHADVGEGHFVPDRVELTVKRHARAAALRPIFGLKPLRLAPESMAMPDVRRRPFMPEQPTCLFRRGIRNENDLRKLARHCVPFLHRLTPPITRVRPRTSRAWACSAL